MIDRPTTAGPTLTDLLVEVRSLRAELAAQQAATARWVDLEQAAIRYPLSVKSFRRLIASGKLVPRRPVKGKLILDVREIDAVIAAAKEP